MINNTKTIASSIALFCLVFFAMGQTQILDKTAKDKLIGDINRHLTGTDPAQMNLATQGIKDLLTHGELPSTLMGKWLPVLVAQKRNQDVADIALATLMLTPDPNNGLKLMEMRTKALLDMDRPQEALVSAKIAYNLCAVSDTEKAIDLLCIALTKANPNDKTIARRFRLEQAEGQASNGDLAGNASHPAETNLTNIKIDTALFGAWLDTWKAKQDTLGDRIKYGNLLLAADHSVEAEAIFRNCMVGAAPKDIGNASEGVARALRAEDGTLSRACAWLASLNESAAGNTSQPAEQRFFSIIRSDVLRLSPRSIIRSAKIPDAGLLDWIDHWESSWSQGQNSTAADIDSLGLLLKHSTLQAKNLLLLARAIHFISQNKTLATAFYDGASIHVQAELSRQELTEPQVAPLLIAIQSQLDDLKAVSNRSVENTNLVGSNNEIDPFDEVETRIYVNYVIHIPNDNPEMIKASYRPIIIGADALNTMYRSQEALEVLLKLSTITLGRNEKSEWAWLCAMTLIKLHRDAEAVPYLRFAAGDKASATAIADKIITTQPAAAALTATGIPALPSLRGGAPGTRPRQPTHSSATPDPSLP